MMRASALALFCLALGACASGAAPSGTKEAFTRASDAAFSVTPRADPLPLPLLDPPTRLQSELERLDSAQIVRWVRPADTASPVVATDILRGHMPRPTAIVLYEAPRETDLAGVCAVSGDDVWLRVPNENTLTYQQHLDPPLQPYQRQPFLRWKVIGSTLGSTPARCAGATPGRDWFEAPSAEMVFRAINAVEQAQRGVTRPRLVCQQLKYEEARQDFATPACLDARALLAELTPDLIRRVRPADCVLAASPRGCLGIEYDDPAAPGSHSLYVVTVPDEDQPAYVQITQAMLPPS